MNRRLIIGLLVFLLLLPAVSIGIWSVGSSGWVGKGWIGGPKDFVFIIKSDNAGTSNDDQFTLPLPGAGVYDCTIDWGDGGAPEVKNTNTSVTHTFLGGAGTYTITISGTFPAIYFNNGGDKLKLLTVTNLGEVGWTSFSGAFYGCATMTSFVGVTADTSAITSMASMFRNCTSLTSVDVSSFDTALVTNMASTFRNCSSLTSVDVSGFDTAIVIYMTYMFRNCSSLTSLDLSSFDTALVTTLSNMFYGCTSLTSLDLSSFDTALVTSMLSMFYDCTSLTSVDVSSFDTALVTAMHSMFRNCSLLDVDVSAFDITLMTDATNMFYLSGFTQTNYDLLLVAWEVQVEQVGVIFHAGTAMYGAGAPATARGALVANGWGITDGGAE